MMRRIAIVSTTIVFALRSKNGIATAVITLAHAAVHWSQHPRLHSLSTIYPWRSDAKFSPCCSNAPEDAGTDGLRDSYKLTPVDVRLFAVSKKLKAETEAVFYHENSFRFLADDPLPLFIRLAAAAASDENGTPHPALSLKSIHINISYPRADPDSREETHAKKVEQTRSEKFATIAKMLAKCKRLEIVRFTNHCSTRLSYGRKDLKVDFDGLGQGFDDLLGSFDKWKAPGVVVFKEGRIMTDDYGGCGAELRDVGSMWRGLRRPRKVGAVLIFYSKRSTFL